MASEEVRVLVSRRYGPVVSTIEPDCHRYESRFEESRSFGMAGAVLALSAGGGLMKFGLSISDPVAPVLGAVLLLLGFWFFYFSTRQLAVLTLTPGSIELTIRGFVPFHRSGSWSWTPDKLADVIIETADIPARIRTVPISSVRLVFDGSGRVWKTFLNVDSPELAEELGDDIIESAAQMMKRYYAAVDAGAKLP